MRKILGILIFVLGHSAMANDLGCNVAVPITVQLAKDALALCVRQQPDQVSGHPISADLRKTAVDTTRYAHNAEVNMRLANTPNISRPSAAGHEAQSHANNIDRYQALFLACTDAKIKLRQLVEHAQQKCARELQQAAGQMGGLDGVVQQIDRSIDEHVARRRQSVSDQLRMQDIAAATSAAPVAAPAEGEAAR